MTKVETRLVRTRSALLIGSAILSLGIPTWAFAQTSPDSDSRLEDIVVTAQKREQNLQDVPIAVTAISGNTLEVNRITSVSDLSGLAPGVTVRTAAGGSQLASFAIRGAVSYGVVPGSDKEVSVYIDGVYISSARGGIFDLPDISRIEMLRGPQGTLFGRNATAGAVSITTRDPDGEFGVTASGTIGNYDQNRERISINTPQIGPFSAYFTYVHDYKRGDIQNASAGQIWDRSAAGVGTAVSPEWLGTKRSNSYFAAVKFQPIDDLKFVYKFDRNDANGTPEATGFVGVNLTGPGAIPSLAPLINAVLTGQATPVHMAPDGKRPDVVNNGFAIPSDQTTYGHSLTATWQATDSLSVKNILAYRYSHIFATSALDGFSSLPFTSQSLNIYATTLASAVPGFPSFPPATQAAIIQQVSAGLAQAFTVGAPFVALGNQPETEGKQWSDELQVNYNSKLLTLTAGGIWFHSDERSGLIGLPGSVAFATVPGGVVTGSQAVNYNKATSLAAYAQIEVHATSQLDLIGGIRITNDKKSGSLEYGLPGAISALPFTYEKTKPNYLVGINYRPNDEILLYGKFSTAFVSGGSVAGLDFEPETATSWEAGVKADLFDKRVRANLALFSVKYEHFQTAQSASNFPGLFPTPPYPAGIATSIGTIIVDQGGPVKAKGFEFEATIAPTRGITAGGSLGYTDTKFYDVNPVLIAQSLGQYAPALRAKWTGALWGQYVSEPLFEEATLLLRVDTTYHGTISLTQHPDVNAIPAFAGIDHLDPSWQVNARAALRDIGIGGAKVELAAWVKNLTQNREATFSGQYINMLGSANYVPARTFGADLTVKF